MPNHTVLVVEDDISIRESLAETLEDFGYDVVSAVNGKQALQKLKESAHRPCLILLDLMMPIMDGRAFRQVQRECPEIADIPVVVLSAYRDVEAEVREMAVSDFVKKPLRLDELLGITRRYCSGGATVC